MDPSHHAHFADSPSKLGSTQDHLHSVGLTVKFCPLCASPLEMKIPQHDTNSRPCCSACGYVHYLDPKVSACAMPIHDGKVVLLQRAMNPEKGKWVFPGGFVDRGERVDRAAIRETKEEVGVDVELTRLLNVYSYENFDVIIIVFLARIIGGVLQAAHEATDVKLFGSQEIPWDDLAFRTTGDALRDWLQLGPSTSHHRP